MINAMLTGVAIAYGGTYGIYLILEGMRWMI